MAKLFDVGKQFPPEHEIERLAKYKRMRKIYRGKLYEVYERATRILKGTPQEDQLNKLHIAVNIVDPIVKKPADLLVGEKPVIDTGLPSESTPSQRVASIVEENDLQQLIHESVVGGGYRGDSFIKVRYGYRQDYSELDAMGFELPTDAVMEPVIEHVNASTVFPEVSENNVKRFKAINIATVEYIETKKREYVYLNVERHLPGYIFYERYRMVDKGVDSSHGAPIPTFTITERVDTGRDQDVVATGASYPLVFHIPYSSLDDDWRGEGAVEKIVSLLGAITDRVVQIDYILWKHSDPAMYGPPIGADESTRAGGQYIEVEKDDVTPGYLTWSSQLDAAFKELDLLLGLVFQISETPDWLFGTSIIGDGNKAGGTSHTSNAAIKSRFLPILSKVNRIKAHVDKAIRDAIWCAQIIENYANEGVEGFEKYEPIYPNIAWYSGVPKDEKEEAEIANIRTGGKPTLDVKTAIRRMDDLDDIEAKKIIDGIDDDETRVNGFVDASIYNEVSNESLANVNSGGDEQ